MVSDWVYDLAGVSGKTVMVNAEAKRMDGFHYQTRQDTAF
jgi:hypothetical protein